MKQAILAVLMLMLITTPCLAQEVEPDGMFSIEGTRWRVCQIFFQTKRPIISLQCERDLAFYNDSVYSCTCPATCRIYPFLQYIIDTPIVGVTWEVHAGCGVWGSPFCMVGYQVAVMQPFGLGIHSIAELGFAGESLFAAYGIGIMFKVEDDWTPPEV